MEHNVFPACASKTGTILHVLSFCVAGGRRCVISAPSHHSGAPWTVADISPAPMVAAGKHDNPSGPQSPSSAAEPFVDVHAEARRRTRSGLHAKKDGP